MAITLGHNQYGKAETRVVRIFRDTEPHEIADYNVSVALVGDFDDVHYNGDNTKCLTTDATKNTVNAYAKEAGDAVRQPESFGIALAKHFVDDVPQVSRVRIQIEAYPWDRLSHNGTPHPHAFARRGAYVRTVTVTYDGSQLWVVSGVRDLIVLKTTDSEFHTFYQERYTTLRPTDDRIMASSVTAQWLHTETDTDWGASYDRVLATLGSTFAGHHSLALQQTMYAIGQDIITEQPEIARDPLLDAEQAPLPRRPQPVRRGEQERGLPRRRPALRLHRGHRPPRRRPEPRPGRVRPRSGLVSPAMARTSSAATTVDRHPVDQMLPAGQLLLYGLQHVMSMYAGVIAVPLIVGSALGLPFPTSPTCSPPRCWCPGWRPCCRPSASGRSAPSCRSCRARRSPPSPRCSPSARTPAAASRGLQFIFGAILVAGVDRVPAVRRVQPAAALLPAGGHRVGHHGDRHLAAAGRDPLGGRRRGDRTQRSAVVANIGLAALTLAIILLIYRFLPGFFSRIAILAGLVVGTLVARRSA